MRYVVVSVYDVAAEAFGRPAFVASKGAAIRSFQDEVSREAPDNVMHQHPLDFQLFELGCFDDSDGSFTLLNRPTRIATGGDVSL